MELAGVGVRYGRRAPWVLQEVGLQLTPGTLVEVTGRNGAGKSSLLRVLAGVLPPAAGRISGRPEVVGWAPERFPATQPFTVASYLRAQARIRGLRDDRAAVAVDREVDRFGLGSLVETALGALSKGSGQKVGLAQALLVTPGLLVLDEPWSGLDASARTALPGVVREVLDHGGSVVLADHQQQAAALSPSAQWHVADGTVTVRPSGAIAPVLLEVQVPVDQVPGVVALLRDQQLDPRVR